MPSGNGIVQSDDAAASEKAEQVRWFTEEVHPHEQALRAWLQGDSTSLPDVDDIVQESYLRLLRARASGQIQCVKAYLFGIARHVRFEGLRKKRLFSDIPVNALPESPTLEENSDVVELVSIAQELELATEAMKTLPDRCREIVMLRALHGLSYKEIAARMGLAEETVRVQMARGVKKCAQYFRERGIHDRRHP